VVGGHVNAVRVEFPGSNRQVFALREPRDDINGMWLMRAQLGLDEDALAARHAGKPVVLLVRERTFLYHEPTEVAFRQRLCGLFESVERVDGHTIAPGKVHVDGYIAVPRAKPLESVQTCGLMPSLYLARPLRGDTVPAEGINAFGMAASPAGIARVEVMVDGKVLREANIGLDPPGFKAPDALAYDPDYPAVQFDFPLNGREIGGGPRTLTVRATRRDGTVEVLTERTIYGVD
jgi:hypothetical protein